MEIRNVLTRQSITSPNQTLIVQKGETYDAVIKESQGGAAVVVIKGIEVQVRTEGEWPQEGRVAIKIVGEQDGVPVARIVPRPPQETDKQPVYFSASEPLSSELRQVGDWLQKHGQSLTKEIVSTLRTFFTEAPGTVEQKLETVRAVINKKLELTSTHLAAVHEALHGKPLGEQFAEIANKLDPAFTLAQREEQSAMKETPHHLAVAADQFERQAWRTGKTGELSSAPPSLAADQSAKAGSTEGTKSSEISGRKALGHRPLVPTWDHLERTVQMETASTTETSTRLQQVREQVAREPSLSKAVEYVRQQVVDAPNVDRDVAEQVDRALREVVQLQRQGRESEARARLIEALVKAEQAARASEAGRQLRDTHLQASQDLRDQIQEVRTQVAKAPDLSKALEQVQKQLVENIDVSAEVREIAAVAVKEAQWLKMNGQEILARRTLVRALEDMERVVQPEAAPATETSTRLQQVREQVVREPNLSKAVEYVRQQVVDAPNVDRDVVEQVDRALREVAQLQRQGRESEARARLSEVLVKAEQAARALEATVQSVSDASQPSPELPKQIRAIRTEAVRALNLSNTLSRVQKLLAEHSELPGDVRQKIEAVLKETMWLQQAGQHAAARTHLVRQLDQIESITANTRSSVVQPPSPVNETTAPFKMPAVDHISVLSEMAEGAGQGGISQRSTAPVVEQSGDDAIGNGARQAISSAGSQNEVTADAANDTQPIEQLREAMRRAIKSLQQEPHLEKALDAVGADIAEALRTHPHWEQAWADSSASARTLMEKGRELAARQTVLKTLNEIEASLPSVPTDRSMDVDSLFDGAWQAALSLESKQFFVQTVTKKMAQAALDFKTVKRDVMRQLETVAQVAENKSPAARLQATSMLEMAIKQLDNAILKSDIMLFTDMVTEKQLMKASSALAEAKKRLRQGDAAGARNIVNEVKNMLANIVFKPSEAKVKHFVRMHGETTADSSKAFLEQVNQVMQPPVDGPSARHVFDTIRRLGLMHEYEAAERLVLKGNEEESALPNIKEVLLRLAQSGNESVARQAEQALTNLTGQQLLNKWDGTAGWQSVFFTLPLLWQNEVQNVNVYVNARQHGERIDWENCQLYFLLETKKLGDLGILLQANERNLSITLRNDRDDFAEKVKPFIDIAKEKLEEIGYRVTAVNVAKLTNDAHQKDEPPSPAPSAHPYRRFAERGYDWTI
ncbi:hypothetical protein AVP43_00949 [Geobacillus stearothermophilus]|uniref:hypothetical protein n=1 Tax=Geobacillus sp. DSP4a TaxID=2508873 RepID=UPI0007AB67E6|nr:hypothetical protein [Geobacillus sp. DSP4a]KZE97109.1 hypothetical protein AVP43_00949 [Geobacillus stearothermophilus]